MGEIGHLVILDGRREERLTALVICGAGFFALVVFLALGGGRDVNHARALGKIALSSSVYLLLGLGMLGGVDRLEVDVDKGLYRRIRGFWPFVRTTEGLISDISWTRVTTHNKNGDAEIGPRTHVVLDLVWRDAKLPSFRLGSYCNFYVFDATGKAKSPNDKNRACCFGAFKIADLRAAEVRRQIGL